MKNLKWRRLYWLHINTVIWTVLFALFGFTKIAAVLLVVALAAFIASAISLFVWTFKP